MLAPEHEIHLSYLSSLLIVRRTFDTRIRNITSYKVINLQAQTQMMNHNSGFRSKVIYNKKGKYFSTNGFL